MAAYPGYPPAGFYQYPDHPRDLKKTYLALLPAEQIIEICLTLDYYVPLHFKGALWPLDLQGTIDAIRAVKEKEEREKREQEQAQREREQQERDRQNAPSQDAPSTDPPPEGGNAEGSTADKAQEPPAPAPEANAASSTSTPTPQPQPPITYGFPYYPYGPYPPPPGYPLPPGQPPSADAPVAQPAPAPQPPPPPPPPLTYPHPSHPLYSNSPASAGPSRASQGPQPLPAASSDGNGPTVGPSAGMPSYEDMIVEALLEAENAPPDEKGQRPDGLAPKDVYAWMAAHYSLQSNFRPSASQALQKAYKRGRLEKDASGKYKVNHNAGASSLPMTRRNNRRPHPSGPQPSGTIRSMHITTPSSASASTPVFTNSNSQNLDALFTLTQALEQKGAQAAAAAAAPADTSGGDAAAYEAAQTLLKAIQERYAAESGAHDPYAPQATAGAQAAVAPDGQDAMDVDMEGLDADTRAHLQAQLALLAAQLTEIAYAEQVEAADELAGMGMPPASAPQPQQPAHAGIAQWQSQFTTTAPQASTSYAPQPAGTSYAPQLPPSTIPIDPALSSTVQPSPSHGTDALQPQVGAPQSAQSQLHPQSQAPEHSAPQPAAPTHEPEQRPEASPSDAPVPEPPADPTTTDTETADEMDHDMAAQMEADMDAMSRDMEEDMAGAGAGGTGNESAGGAAADGDPIAAAENDNDDDDDDDEDSDDDEDMEEVEVPAFVHEQVQAIMGQLGVA